MEDLMQRYVGRTSLEVVLVYSIIGAALGLGVDSMNKKVSTMLPDINRNKWTRVFVKMTVVGVALLVVHQMNPRFASDWQSTTPGLFFVSLFFGLQGDLMNALNQLNT